MAYDFFGDIPVHADITGRRVSRTVFGDDALNVEDCVVLVAFHRLVEFKQGGGCRGLVCGR